MLEAPRERLALREANRIPVIDRGQIVKQGTHAELLRHQGSHYSRLHRLQMASAPMRPL